MIFAMVALGKGAEKQRILATTNSTWTCTVNAQKCQLFTGSIAIVWRIFIITLSLNGVGLSSMKRENVVIKEM